MIWTCPNCGHAIRMQRVVLPVYCACKFVDRTQDNLRSEGLGDTIAKITTAIGIKPCGGGCEERQAKLNALVPYATEHPRTTEPTPAPPSPQSLPD